VKALVTAVHGNGAQWGWPGEPVFRYRGEDGSWAWVPQSPRYRHSVGDMIDVDGGWEWLDDDEEREAKIAKHERMTSRARREALLRAEAKQRPTIKTPVHATKKSARQLEREIAAALLEQAASGDVHAREVLNDLIEQRGGPKRADFSGNIKRMFREIYGVKVRMRTNPTKNPFIEAWIRESDLSPPFPPEVRNTALDVVYGEAFARNRDNPSAGNVRPLSIALHKPQWVELFRRLGHRLEEI
jgi:hypothetical protein